MISAARPVASSASSPILDERGMALDPAGLLGSSAPAIGQFRDSAPQRKRFLEAGDRLAGVARGGGVTSQSGGRFVARGIDVARGEGPARSLRQDEAVAQGATQRGDVGLQGFGGGARWILAPEQFDECVCRHNRAAVQPEHREDDARLGARYGDGRPALSDLKRSQNPQLHGLKRSHVTDRACGDSTRGQDRVKANNSEPVIATVVATAVLALLVTNSRHQIAWCCPIPGDSRSPPR